MHLFQKRNSQIYYLVSFASIRKGKIFLNFKVFTKIIRQHKKEVQPL